MRNFTVGPVAMSQDILNIGSEQIPYFRTAEFSKLMLENEAMILRAANAPAGSRAVFLTGSGTSGMEAAVVNLFDEDDKVLVVNGGSFGARFAEICRVYGIPHEEVKLSFGKQITANDLAPFENQGFTGLLVNIHETSTGVLYDAELLSAFCRRNNLKFVVDAISSFLADPFDMSKIGADAVIVGSQKAIALPPGISAVLLSSRACEVISLRERIRCFYLNLKEALKNGERGQTPFTPAVGILLQMHKRLSGILTRGVAEEIRKAKRLAQYFRERIANFPFVVASESCSNAVTSLRVLPECKSTAFEIFEILKNEYGIFVCPNGGDLRDSVFRVGHIGELTANDYEALFSAFEDMKSSGKI
ncbi:MAG: alanine--glyoxylate aminotransferase family protein [Verrucomicrobia bacterium]|nr:alanine--glyoxylate aminotransferase family protein [Verrucomicrobiota bacterium]